MLGADVVVVEEARFLDGVAYDRFGARRKRDVAHGAHAAAGGHEFFDLAPDHLQRKAELAQDQRRAALALADEAQQYMFGAHGVVVQPRRFLARDKHHFPSPGGKFI